MSSDKHENGVLVPEHSRPGLSRRRFLGLGAAGAAALTIGSIIKFHPQLSGSGGEHLADAALQTIRSTCALCVNKCGIEAQVRDGVRPRVWLRESGAGATVPMTERRQRILEEWNEYKRKCVPRDASFAQVRETRQAFYGGAHVALTLIHQFACEPESEGAENKLEEMYRELDDFRHRVLRECEP